LKGRVPLLSNWLDKCATAIAHFSCNFSDIVFSVNYQFLNSFCFMRNDKVLNCSPCTSENRLDKWYNRDSVSHK
jgi:hypothetical protein